MEDTVTVEIPREAAQWLYDRLLVRSEAWALIITRAIEAGGAYSATQEGQP